MACRIADMRHKEVINVKDGVKIGYVDDVEFDTVSAELTALVVYGKSRFFGLFGRDEDIVITWQDIEVIGEDTVLVSFDAIRSRQAERWVSFPNCLISNTDHSCCTEIFPKMKLSRRHIVAAAQFQLGISPVFPDFSVAQSCV